MSEESRLGREQIETAYALKQIHRRRRGRVPVSRGSRADADNAMDKVMASLTNFASERERERRPAADSRCDAPKAARGHVAGARSTGTATSRSARRHARPRRARESCRREPQSLPDLRRDRRGSRFCRIAKDLNVTRSPAPRAAAVGDERSVRARAARLYRGRPVLGKTRWG